jgi:hypothetical protein
MTTLVKYWKYLKPGKNMFILVVIIFANISFSGQFCFPERVTEPDDDLILRITNNKTILSEYAEQVVTALLFFPDLVDLRVNFQLKNLKTTMAGQLFFPFLKGKKNGFIPFSLIPIQSN